MTGFKNNLISVLRDAKTLWLFIAVLVLKITFFDVLISGAGIFDKEYFFHFVTCVGSTLVLVSLTFLFSPRFRPWLMLIADAAFSVLLLADHLYFVYNGDVISISLVQLGLQLPAVRSAVFSLLSPIDSLFFVDFLFLVPYTISVSKRPFEPQSVNKRIWGMLCLCVIGWYLFAFEIAYSILAFNVAGAAWTNYDSRSSVRQVGALGFHELDIAKCLAFAFLDEKTPTEEELNAVLAYAAKPEEESSLYAGSGKGLNLIMIQVESLQEFVIGAEVNGQEITPNLNRLAGETLFFSNVYNQIRGGGTSDAEFLSLTSLYPLSYRSVFVNFAGNSFQSSLPSRMKEAGYGTTAYHGFRGTYWNRRNMYSAMGFSRFLDQDHFSTEESGQQETAYGSIGTSDTVFFKESMQDISKTDPPFFAFLVTLTSHYPYTFLKGYEDGPDISGFENYLLGKYFSNMSYADSALGSFINDLKNNGLWDRSVVVIYGDHKGIRQPKEDGLEKYLGKELTEEDTMLLDKVPLFIHIPGVSPKRFDVIGGHIDIYPTIANIMGIEAPPTAMGRDLLGSGPEFAVFPDGGYIDSSGVYPAGNVPEDKETIVRQQLEASEKIITWDAYDKTP